LIAKTLNDFKLFENLVTELDKKVIELKYNHFDQKRRQKIRDLISTRANIIEEEKTGLWSTEGGVIK